MHHNTTYCCSTYYLLYSNNNNTNIIAIEGYVNINKPQVKYNTVIAIILIKSVKVFIILSLYTVIISNIAKLHKKY